VSALALIAKDDIIAGLLTRNGLKTGHGNRWTRERVTALRSSYRIAVHREAADGKDLWLNLGEAAALVGVAPRTLRLAAERGQIAARHPLEDGPWIFSRAELESAAARDIASQAKATSKHPTVSDPAQESLLLSTT
jgi:hypothetical protein